MLASTLGTTFILKEKPLEVNQVASIVVVSISLYLFNYDKIYPTSAPSSDKAKPKDDIEANKK